MKPTRAIFVMLSALGIGCGGNQEVKPEIPVSLPPAPKAEIPPPEPPPAPKAAFDPRNKDRTYQWIKDEATALRLKYLPARDAIQANPLNDDLLKAFVANDLPPYKAQFEAMVGKQVAWNVKVFVIEKDGIIIDGWTHILTEPFINNGQDKDSISIDLFIKNETVNEDYRLEHMILKLNKQITKEFAKTLKKGDDILIKGIIEKVDVKYGDDKPPSWITITLDNVTAEPVQ